MDELLQEALVPEDEQPYEVPDNWVWVKLDSITEKITDGAHKTPNYVEMGIPFISVKDINNGTVSFGDTKYVSIETHNELKKRCHPENGDILITKSGTIGRTAIIRTDDEFSLFVSVALVKTNINTTDPRFLELYISHGIKLLAGQKFIKGSSIKNLHLNELKKFHIPLAPLNEQKRIANKVESLLNKIDQAKQLIDEAKETFELRRAAILDKAFRGELTAKWREENFVTESPNDFQKKIEEELGVKKKKIVEFENIIDPPYEIPSSWKWVRLSQILDVNPPKEKIDATDDQSCSFVPMASVSDVTGKIEKIEEKDFLAVKKGYTLFKNGDVIFAKITPCMENGKSAIVKEMKNGYGFGSTEFYVIRTSEYVTEKLIHFLVRSRKFRAEAKAVMTGAVGQQRVPKSFIEDYLFPLPPKMEQEKIISLLNSIYDNDEEVTKIISLETALNQLKQSILSKAFRGELGTNDPTEESAIELLKEVLQEKLQ
jgi:type I restriction enzyme S subunit